MIGERLKLLRLARGLTMEELVAKIGGIVTKQAISKYELGKDIPSSHVLTKLAGALGVKSVHLWGEPSVSVELVAYRKRSGLSKGEQSRVESIVVESLEQRVKLQELTDQKATGIPAKSFHINSVADAEAAAAQIRTNWRLGLDPIASVTGVLEDHLIHVIEIPDAKKEFDGISALAKEGGRLRAAAVASRQALPGERQRLNLAHELGHLVMDVRAGVDEEKAAFRFAGAFLAPVEVLHREVGKSRAAIGQAELLLLKKSLGMSMQAILYRLRDLHTITETHFKQWFMMMSRAGFRTAEPYPLPSEVPTWLPRTLLRLLAEGLISNDDAERILGGATPLPSSALSLVQRKAFMSLPVEQRRQQLAEDAERLREFYEGVVARGEVDVADTR